jgi:C4-dicarboxylate-specific signal transduction histidine kinase
MIGMSQDTGHLTEIVITDTGPGIDYDLAKEVFNPFYTTKGKSLGLGLPVSRRVIEAHEGTITVGSDLTAGARVMVRMPGLALMDEGQVEKGLDKGLGLN